jgi:galactose oxidase
VSKVTWISLGSVTHSYNENRRATRLNLPPGYYLLFIVDSPGVPSAAKIVRIG